MSTLITWTMECDGMTADEAEALRVQMGGALEKLTLFAPNITNLVVQSNVKGGDKNAENSDGNAERI